RYADLSVFTASFSRVIVVVTEAVDVTKENCLGAMCDLCGSEMVLKWNHNGCGPFDQACAARRGAAAAEEGGDEPSIASGGADGNPGRRGGAGGRGGRRRAAAKQDAVSPEGEKRPPGTRPRERRRIAPASESALIIRQAREGRTFTAADLHTHVVSLGTEAADIARPGSL